jgi:hypothetical protein
MRVKHSPPEPCCKGPCCDREIEKFIIRYGNKSMGLPVGDLEEIEVPFNKSLADSYCSFAIRIGGSWNESTDYKISIEGPEEVRFPTVSEWSLLYPQTSGLKYGMVDYSVTEDSGVFTSVFYWEDIRYFGQEMWLYVDGTEYYIPKATPLPGQSLDDAIKEEIEDILPTGYTVTIERELVSEEILRENEWDWICESKPATCRYTPVISEKDSKETDYSYIIEINASNNTVLGKALRFIKKETTVTIDVENESYGYGCNGSETNKVEFITVPVQLINELQESNVISYSCCFWKPMKLRTTTDLIPPKINYLDWGNIGIVNDFELKQKTCNRDYSLSCEPTFISAQGTVNCEVHEIDYSPYIEVETVYAKEKTCTCDGPVPHEEVTISKITITIEGEEFEFNKNNSIIRGYCHNEIEGEEDLWTKTNWGLDEIWTTEFVLKKDFSQRQINLVEISDESHEVEFEFPARRDFVESTGPTGYSLSQRQELCDDCYGRLFTGEAVTYQHFWEIESNMKAIVKRKRMWYPSVVVQTIKNGTNYKYRIRIKKIHILEETNYYGTYSIETTYNRTDITNELTSVCRSAIFDCESDWLKQVREEGQLAIIQSSFIDTVIGEGDISDIYSTITSTVTGLTWDGEREQVPIPEMKVSYKKTVWVGKDTANGFFSGLPCPGCLGDGFGSVTNYGPDATFPTEKPKSPQFVDNIFYETRYQVQEPRLELEPTKFKNHSYSVSVKIDP